MSVAPAPSAAAQTLQATCAWLKTRQLTAKTLPIDFRDLDGQQIQIDPAQAVLAAPQQRAEKHQKEELEKLKQKWRGRKPTAISSPSATPAVVDQLDALLDRKIGNLFLDIKRLPSNAIAFYRPYHLEPMDRWGIYIFVDRLLRYADQVRFGVPFFPEISKELFMHLVLFEMFHHEFYHHLWRVRQRRWRSWRTLGAEIPKYLEYRQAAHARRFCWHTTQPLEEALANAYAYNSLSFISRVRAGYRDALVASYQKALAAHWLTEGPGYKHASRYISCEQVPANGDLLAMLLGRMPHPALLQVAHAVMPSGFSAFLGKPDIPTYLVGNPGEIDRLHELVPAPNETYCHLFWPVDTSRVDEMLKARHRERVAAKKAKKA
jgi:hypothetical protein